MYSFSTPVRKKGSPRLSQANFSEVTPIKPSEDSSDEFNNYKLSEMFKEDNSLFDEYSTKHGLVDDLKSGECIESQRPYLMRKKQKISEEFSILHRNGTVNEMDMFDEPMDFILTQSFKLDSNSKKLNSDIVEDSILKSQKGTYDEQLMNLSIINELDENESHNYYSLADTDDCGKCSGDTCDLNISIKDNAVIESILGKMNVENSKEESSNNDTTDLKGYTQILMESVVNWDKESNMEKKKMFEGSTLGDKIKIKLLNNVNNLKVTKSDTSGWSQMENSLCNLEDSVIQKFDYQELGPFFGLPSKVQNLYKKHKGIQDLYYWQKECLSLKAVKERKNLVYSLPTSGGKTLVAEILIMRELMCYKKNVLFILPFVSIVQEKVHDLSIFALELGFLVEEYAAGKGTIPLKKRRKMRSVVISTIEKARAVIISLIETKQLQDFGLIVVDELHLVSEGSGRGAILETLLTLVLHLEEKIQIIGMTATIGNLNEIATFLKAESYTGNFRPVELNEYVKCGTDVFAVNWNGEEVLQRVRTMKSPITGPDPDGVSDLVIEIVPKDSVLVFCPTKKNCENVALLISDLMPKNIANYKEAEKMSFFRALQTETNNQVCPVLRKTIPYGVVYHHSGLTPGERKLIEEAFRSGTLCVICCTSTLAAGVNLPAARVILRSPYVAKDFISLSKYKQMVGRAGRAGMGSKGESYLICQASDCGKVGALLQSKMDESTSTMGDESLRSLILTAIGLGIGTTREELRKIVSCTLLSVQAKKLGVDVKKMIDSCITSLFKMGAVKVKDPEHVEYEDGASKLDITIRRPDERVLVISNNSHLSISQLGRAAVKGCIGLERAHELYGDLIKAQSSLVLLTDLHLVYVITPYDVLDQVRPNYSVYFSICMQLTPKELSAAKTVGITEFVISKLATGIKPKSVPERVFNRFYVALILYEMLKQQNVWEVAKLFQLSGGLLQSLMTSASAFANNVLRFSEELSELWSFKCLLNDFAPRLAHCCSTELLPLMELPAVKRGRAKQLFDAGFKSLQILANADSNELVRLVDHLPRKVASEIVAAARLLLIEKAENLKEEAEEVLLGLAEKAVPD